MKVSVKQTGLVESEVPKIDQVIFDAGNDGPKYRITVNDDGTLKVREASGRRLTVSPNSANVITIGATE